VSVRRSATAAATRVEQLTFAERRETDGPGTRARLLHAAAEVIQEGGWAAASVGAIAKRAGVATGTLYRHFDAKADLFVEVFRAVSQREMAAMRDAEATGPSIVERFDAVVATYASRALRNRRLAWALVYEPLDAAVDAERLAYRRTYSQGMAALIRQAIADGAIPRQDADLAAAAVVGVIAETLVGPLSPVAPDRRPDEAIVRAIVTFCRRVIGLPPINAPLSRRTRG
jgi:AcrR family transcriptional regulator